MISRGYVSAALAAAACSVSVFGQLKLPSSVHTVAAGQSVARGASPTLSAQQSRVLWIRNDKTGQMIAPTSTMGKKAADDPQPVFIYNNYDNPLGVAGINLNWNYPGAYTDHEFVPPTGEEPLTFQRFDLASDPTDPDLFEDELTNGEKRALMFEPYHAPEGTWPVADLNERQALAEYTSVVASYSEQFEIRICRIYFFALADVSLPFDSIANRYVLDLQLSFAFVSFAFQGVESPFTFDLTGFDPPLKIKGDGLILTHWMKLSQPPICVGDLNDDGLVEDADFVIFLAQYNILDCADETMPNFCSADLNFDGFVDDADFVIFLKGYNDLLCPAPYVIRKAYAPIAGGLHHWDNDFNLPLSNPLSEAIKIPGTDWPFPNSLVTVPNLGNGPYPDPFEVGCAFFGCQPNFSIYFTTLTGFHTVSELNMDADDLKPEYERFLNQVVTADKLHQMSFFIRGTAPGGDYTNAKWLPSSTAKRLSIMPPASQN